MTKSHLGPPTPKSIDYGTAAHTQTSVKADFSPKQRLHSKEKLKIHL